MKRKQFIQSLAILPFTGTFMKLKALNKINGTFTSTEKMPVLFLGHGSPMNAIEENEFVSGFRKVGNEITKPNAIMCISAHWETRGTQVTAMQNPRTIHDFRGFPKELYEVQYPANGSPELAQETQRAISQTEVHLDEHWGLDHGTWSVIKHMYPDADVPVIQLSLDYTKPASYHFELARQLSPLREKGILIVGSGNIVHNLGKIDWQRLNDYFGYDWANEANTKIKGLIENGDFAALINYEKLGSAFKLAIPTPEHYLPLLYILALQRKQEAISFFNDKAIGGSISMTSVKIE